MSKKSISKLINDKLKEEDLGFELLNDREAIICETIYNEIFKSIRTLSNINRSKSESNFNKIKK